MKNSQNERGLAAGNLTQEHPRSVHEEPICTKDNDLSRGRNSNPVENDSSTHCVPRLPGLSDAGCPTGDLHAYRVRQEEARILEQLTDPYYREALLRLTRRGDIAEALNDRGGLLPWIGRYARKLQEPKRIVPKRGRGAPQKPKLANYKLLTKLWDAKPRNKSLIQALRELFRQLGPSASESAIEEAAEAASVKIRSYRNRQQRK